MMNEQEVRDYLERVRKDFDDVKPKHDHWTNDDRWTNNLMIARIRVLLRVLGESDSDY